MFRRLCSVAAVLALAGCGSYAAPGDDDGASEATAWLADDVFVRYPASWHRAGGSVTASPDDPGEVLALGTYPLRAGGGRCAHVPVRALEDLGPHDALLVLFERREPWDPAAYPRRRGPLGRGFERGWAPYCVPGHGRKDVWLAFSDHGRAFEALLATGPEASAEVREQLFAVLDSLAFVGP